jgi:hypothetical protein
MSNKPVIVIALSALLTGAAFAQVDLQTQPVAAEAMESNIEGEVMVVNTDTRLMTLKTADGTYEVLHVPPEVKRLDEIKIGDMVSITETTTALIELQTGRDAGAMGAEGETEVTAQPGDKPAGTVTIKGAETTRVFPVEDMALLDELKVGDGVVAKFRNVISGEVTVK